MKNTVLNSLVNPPAEFSPMPFWFWNDELNNNTIISQIQDMYEHGVEGFVLHPRIGIPENIKYMSDEYLSYVRCAVEEASRLGMQVILYDEGMYPSGSAHGMVVEQNRDFASKGIRIEEGTLLPMLAAGEKLVAVLSAYKTGDMMLDGASIHKSNAPADNEIMLYLISGYTGGHIRGIHIGEDDWESPPASADLLNPKATECFVNLTHERYYQALSEYFGNTVIAMFTDEPCIMGREGDARMMPWTDGFEMCLAEAGFQIEDLPALWYNVGENTEKIRILFNKTVENKLTETFYKPIHDWCAMHSIALCGHPAESTDIGLLKYFHIPGQDLIFRRVAPEGDSALYGKESTQAKCSSDAARHRGCRRNLNECFACSGKDGVEWRFSADDMKWMIDWLTIRGVNLLVPHAFFYSINGERRLGERPPDVGPHNIWWKHYNVVSIYIKRMCAIMTDSVNTASTAILCESDNLPYKAAKLLYTNQIEFNYLEEELFIEECRIENAAIYIRNQKYTTLIIENPRLITKKVLDFISAGGKVICFGFRCDIKGIISAEESDILINNCERDVIITPKNDSLRISHVVKDDEHFYILVNEGEESICGRLTLKSCGEISIFDPWKGNIVKYEGEPISINRRESLIISAGGNTDTRTDITLENPIAQIIVPIESWWCDEAPADLGTDDTLKDYCNGVRYSAQFDVPDCNLKRCVVNLGEVYEQAEVSVNGEYAGFRMWAPYTVDITPYIKEGVNTLNVTVTGTLANRYTDTHYSAGLSGPVNLEIYK